MIVPLQGEPPVLSYVAGIITSVGTLTVGIISILNHFSIKAGNKEINSVKKTGEATHTLSNSAMGAQLAINVELLQALSVQAHRFATMTGQEGDTATAKAFDVRVTGAQKLYQEHLTKQAVVDAELKLAQKKED